MIHLFAAVAVVDVGVGVARAVQRSQAPRRDEAPGPQLEPLRRSPS
jgi:hypothetical protein